MSFAQAVSTCLSKYATFTGRARRAEYWWFTLSYVLLLVVAMIADAVIGTDPVLYFLAIAGTFLPSLAVAVRRLHDTDRSGWLILVTLIPLIGSIIAIVWLASAGTRGANPYGVDPKSDQVGAVPVHSR